MVDIEKLAQNKDKYPPDSRKGIRAAARLADEIMRRREPETLIVPVAAPKSPRVRRAPKELQYAGIEFFEVVAEPVEPPIGSFEDTGAAKYMNMVLDDLDRLGLDDISEGTKQALLEAPFTTDFRKQMVGFVAVQKHRMGKGPIYRG